MLKNISSLGKALSKTNQKLITGGQLIAIDRCCIRVPPHGIVEAGWCNDSPSCCGHRCGCPC